MKEHATAKYEFEQDSPGMDSPLIRAGNSLDKAIAELGEMASLLRDRLHPILRPSEPSPDIAAKLAEIPVGSSPHVTGLHDLAERVHRIRGDLGDLSHRLEV